MVEEDSSGETSANEIFKMLVVVDTKKIVCELYLPFGPSMAALSSGTQFTWEKNDSKND